MPFYILYSRDVTEYGNLMSAHPCSLIFSIYHVHSYRWFTFQMASKFRPGTGNRALVQKFQFKSQNQSTKGIHMPQVQHSADCRQCHLQSMIQGAQMFSSTSVHVLHIFSHSLGCNFQFLYSASHLAGGRREWKVLPSKGISRWTPCTLYWEMMVAPDQYPLHACM